MTYVPARARSITAAAVALIVLAPILTTAQPPTKWKTLDYLYSISGTGAVVGVHNRLSPTPDSFTAQVTQIAGRTPGLWSGDFLFDSPNFENRWTMIHEAERQWNAGAIVNLMWHSCNPTLSEPCNWSDGCNGDGPTSKISDSDWDQLITDGSQLNGRWKQMVDEVAQYVQYLKDKNVEVLFRPLHEMNQGCFWWGGRPGPTGTARLYQITHDYLTNAKGLDNLIWTWDLQDFGSLATDLNDYNPGNEYWDVVALDVYSGYETWKYDAIRGVANGKPMAIGECNILPDANRLVSEPQWTFFMSWSELTFKENSSDLIAQVYNSAPAITLDEMPGWSDPIPPPPTNNNPPPPTAATRSFQSAHGTYLSAWDDGGVVLQGQAQEWEQWTVVASGAATVALQSVHGAYLSAWPDGSVRTEPHAQDWELWTPVQNGDGSTSLRSFHNTYLSAWPDGSVRLVDHDQAWEEWR
jgi:mannan endo-1,4-beta-mannosidase